MSRGRIYQISAAIGFLILGAGPMIVDLCKMIANGSTIRKSIDIESALGWILFILIAVVLFANMRLFFLTVLIGIKVFQDLYVTIWVAARSEMILFLWNGGYLIAFGALLIVIFRRGRGCPYNKVDLVLSIFSVAAFVSGHLVIGIIWGGFSFMSMLLWCVECVALTFMCLWIREIHGGEGHI